MGKMIANLAQHQGNGAQFWAYVSHKMILALRSLNGQ
jgi:hypothetical protein